MLFLNTQNFISKIESLVVTEDAMLISFDVVSLYISIPHDDLRTILQDTFEARVDNAPLTHFLMDLVDILTEHNYFHFGDRYYLRVQGVAMDSVFVPSSANSFMHRLEQSIILNPLENPFLWFIFSFY